MSLSGQRVTVSRKFGVAIVLLVLGAASVFAATYDGPDSDDEVQPVPRSAA